MEQLSFFDGPRYTVLRLHPTRPDYYVLDEAITAYVRLYGPPTGVPYTLREARDEAMLRNTAFGSSLGTYDLPIRQASDEVLRNRIVVPWDVEQALKGKHADLYLSMSGGKDSDAMSVVLLQLATRNEWQGKVRGVHADTGRTEWLQTEDYITHRAALLGVPLYTIQRPQGDLIEEMWQRHRTRPDVPPFPSVQWRWCTSDQKTSQIHKLIRQYTVEGTAVCAIGIRRDESPKRAKQPIWSIRQQAGCSTRLVLDWHPLFFFTEEAVWEALGTTLTHVNAIRTQVRIAREAGQDELAVIRAAQWPYHISYPLGTRRMSCSCCFLANLNDVRIGASYNPDVYRSIVALEIASGFSYFPDTWLGTLCPNLLPFEMKMQLALVMQQRPPHPTSVKI